MSPSLRYVAVATVATNPVIASIRLTLMKTALSVYMAYITANATMFVLMASNATILSAVSGPLIAL